MIIGLDPRTRRAVAVACLVVAGVVAVLELPHLHAHTTTHEWQTPLPVIVLGAMTGLTYGLLAVGLVLIYRTNRIINFAHGQIGAFAAAVFGIEVLRWHVPYWAGLPVALAVGGAVGAVAEVAVIRRLRRAPRLMSVVATLGIGQFLILFAVALNSKSIGSLYPEPPFLPTAEFGALHISRAYFGMVVLAPLAVGGLAWFLQRSRYGLGIRSSAANPDAARLSGVFARRMSTLAWVLAGVLSALTAILTQPTTGYSDPQSFGPSLLLIALTGAVVARMRSLTAAMAAGIGLGIIQQLLLWNFPQGGLVEVVLFAIIVVALLTQPSIGGREQELGSWAAVQPMRPVPDELRRSWLVRNLGLVVALIAAAGAALLPLVITNTASVTMTMIFAFGIVGLSVTVISGLGGQLTLGQFAIAGVAAVVSFVVSRGSGGFLLSFVYAGAAGALASLVLGLPAIRARGLLLTVVTLAFALVVPDWLLSQSWMFGTGVATTPVRLAGHTLETGHAYYYVALVVLLVGMAIVRGVGRGGLGRLLVAVRDNEDNARAFTISASTVKVVGFLVAGFIAGIGGAMYGHALSLLNAATFPTTASINAVVMSVIGGVSMVSGPLLGAALVIGVPTFVPLDSAGLAATALGQLLIIMYLPRGLAGVVEPLRDRIVTRVGRRHVATPDAGTVVHVDRLPASPRPTMPPLAGDLLRAEHLTKRFGGAVAVDDVSLTVRAGEIVGLIGPNGAGKTTTFELLSGFTTPDSGTVQFLGVDISWDSPEERGRRGLIRSFQDARLFPTMSVLDVVQLSLERVAPTRIALGRTRAWRRARADELIVTTGLGAYRAKQIDELSTGTRRIVELACLMALEPTVLLLDEPSSGIAERETEALGARLRSLDTAMVLIEHDIPLVMGLADRVLVMDAGRMIAAGSPEQVRRDPRVIEAYFGVDQAAVNRSDGNAPNKTRRRTTTRMTTGGTR